MGRATAPTVSNNGKARIELEKKKKMGDWDWWHKSKTLSSTNMETSLSKEGRAVPILFFIVAPITIITDKKVGRV